MTMKRKRPEPDYVRRIRKARATLRRRKLTMPEFNSRLNVLDVKQTAYNGVTVRQTRGLLGVSQPIFAQFLGLSPKTVRSWEQDQSKPSEMACRFFDEIRRDPKYWQKRMKSMIVPRPPRVRPKKP
jgi:DNA-binding transcriptional regulator YiaG